MENTPPPSASPRFRPRLLRPGRSLPLAEIRRIVAAPRKPPRKRSAVEDGAVSPKVRRRLVFDNENEPGDEVAERAAGGTGDGDDCLQVPPLSSCSSSDGSAVTQILSCGCTPESRHLLCCELVSLEGSVSVARCPLCYDGESDSSGDGGSRPVSTPPLSASPRRRPPLCPRKRSTTTSSDEHVIVSPFVGLKCHMSTFDGLRGPTLREAGTSGYLPVYAPHDDLFCISNCRRRNPADGAVVIGKGSFGQVWRLGDGRTALKVGKDTLDEALLTLWVSGVVRGRALDAGFAGEVNDSVYCNILTATGSCLRHNVVAFPALDSDLYNYRGWDFSGLSSYRRAFTGLADGIRFLNLQCGVAHFDVTPMNILVQVDPEDGRRLRRAVLCDYSLAQYNGPHDDRCVVVFQQTRTVRALQSSTYYLTDLYHPAFKPLPLQKLSCVEPRARFPHPSARRFCVTDLCALGSVVAFCLVRVLDDRGLPKVRATTENALFAVARKTCEALGRHDEDAVANWSSLLLTRQLAYAVSLLGVDEAREAVADLCHFFAANADHEAVDRFRCIYKRARQEISGSYVVRLLKEALATEDGRYLLENVRATCLLVRLEDLDVGPFSLFP
ncbi:pR97 [rat cytomegalovirus strain Maastricht]|uniref:PR97 n=1 Tax=Rat cytomegalovirus (strain Maastricht) TaxID=79700 RepID=Q9DWA3_RCMVM|nr:pR97 [rat cytomegalovirus strain Maastricht]AAF99187.1 pR97 [rat cytomegalovirus strain Maastricht]WEG72018.1 tegument serine/threonine protein kinase [Murid betaherpesvirus 2]